jgi:peptidylprolyl isomerase
MPVKKGDFILLDYTAKIKETDELFDTTDAEEAKKSGIFQEKGVYEPVLVVVGEGWVVPGLDKELVKSDVGERKKIEIPPAEAFGDRDQNKIKIVPERDLLKQKIRPEVGQRLEVNGQLAIVRSINAGRVQLDFNHPYSGKTLSYDFEIKKVLSEPMEKALELVHRLTPSVKKEEFKINIDDSTIKIDVPENLLYWEALQSFKIRLVRDLIKYLDKVETVVFTEKFTYKPRKEETSKEENVSV